MNGLKRFFVYVFVLAFILSLGVFASAITPSGASTIVSVSNSTAPTTSPTSQEAIAGNVSEISIEGVSTTQSWQGYFGNVTGAIRLADASANVMYNWSIANPSGEVYASTSNSVAWGSIACFDWATNGVALETSYGIGADDADGVNETFATGNGHDEFYTAGTQFTSGTCMSTKVYDDSGQGVDNHFEEVLLHDGSNVVFTSLLEDDVNGFDSAPHDFEMLVLEDGHGTDTATTTYYFYVELE